MTLDYKTDVTPAIISREFVAGLNRAIKSQHTTALAHCDFVA